MPQHFRRPTPESPLVQAARTLLMLLALSLAVAPGVCAQSGKEEPKADAKTSGTAELRIELTGGADKTPIVDASVYVKFTEEKVLRDKKVEYNLKTNQKGVARSPEIPKGRILIQIVSPGWKTFGRYYELTQDEQTIRINLDRPTNRWLQN